jgi:hypothetical protein
VPFTGFVSAAMTTDRLCALFFGTHKFRVDLLRWQSLSLDIYIETKALLFYLDILLGFGLGLLFWWLIFSVKRGINVKWRLLGE